MKRLSQRPTKKRYASLLCLLAFGCIGATCSGVIAAQDPTIGMPQTQDVFEYQLESRNDPFLPFVKEATTVAPINMDEVVEAGDELFGMQLFEPDQLKVVAIMGTKTKQFAMVQDLIGQGYPVTVGTLIGKRGIIKEISPKGVVIEETAVTRSGKKKLTRIVMALKPEGE